MSTFIVAFPPFDLSCATAGLAISSAKAKAGTRNKNFFMTIPPPRTAVDEKPGRNTSDPGGNSERGPCERCYWAVPPRLRGGASAPGWLSEPGTLRRGYDAVKLPGDAVKNPAARGAHTHHRGASVLTRPLR